MIIVSDTSAITSLLQIGQERLLVQLYQSVVIPEAVAAELRRGHKTLPSFLQVVAVVDRNQVHRLAAEIDLGEAEAIVLMVEGRGDLLLLDERRGRRVALREGIPVVGLLGLLTEARQRGLISSLQETLHQLETLAGFRVSTHLKQNALRATGENP